MAAPTTQPYTPRCISFLAAKNTTVSDFLRCYVSALLIHGSQSLVGFSVRVQTKGYWVVFESYDGRDEDQKPFSILGLTFADTGKSAVFNVNTEISFDIGECITMEGLIFEFETKCPKLAAIPLTFGEPLGLFSIRDNVDRPDPAYFWVCLAALMGSCRHFSVVLNSYGDGPLSHYQTSKHIAKALRQPDVQRLVYNVDVHQRIHLNM